MNKFDTALHEAESLIKFLHSRLGLGGEKHLFFQHKPFGSLRLDYEESIRYHDCLRTLRKTFVRGDNLSRRTIANALELAILAALQESNTKGLNERIAEAITDLKQKLTIAPVTYQCIIPVRGIKKEGLPLSVGQVRFCIFDSSIADRFHLAITQHKYQQEFKHDEIDRFIEQNSILGSVCSIVEVEAKDYEAAQVLALKQLRSVLDVLNFFSSRVPNHPDAWGYLPGDLDSFLFWSMILQGASFNLPQHRVGPLMELSIPRVLESDTKYWLGVGYVCYILRKKTINSYEQSLITAIQWAGRAAISERREEVFLLYAIALESIILADIQGAELNYRLRIRTAHLLGNDVESRLKIDKIVRDLYILRSKIVHNGNFEITELELQSIEEIVGKCIQRLCIEPVFQRFSNTTDLADWFNQKILNGSAENKE